MVTNNTGPLPWKKKFIRISWCFGLAFCLLFAGRLIYGFRITSDESLITDQQSYFDTLQRLKRNYASDKFS
jgi:hypothetical protein